MRSRLQVYVTICCDAFQVFHYVTLRCIIAQASADSREKFRSLVLGFMPYFQLLNDGWRSTGGCSNDIGLSGHPCCTDFKH